jgi:hypothetical protein
MVDMDCIMNSINHSIESEMPTNLQELHGKQVVFCNDRSMMPINGWDSVSDEVTIKRIDTIDKDASVVGIDSSCILVGETPDGLIYAAKCSIVLAYSMSIITNAKIGPIIFYINDENMSKSIDDGKRMIRSSLEHIAHSRVAEALSDSILLVDGTLRAYNIMELCVNGNIPIGLSKSTSIKRIARISSSLTKDDYPCYADVTDILGIDRNGISTLLTKLSSNGIVMRVDMHESMDASCSLGLLIANDTLHNGYPETLRLAHHTSIFTNTDLICIKGFMKNDLGVKEVDGYNARSILLGKLF